ncbi:hypothetical protein GGX14DRAFT_456935 [Mycena pura]|uniref:DUF6533 domain-containing protein n=1 Tax=Mycena pura TaxID=153505 RepID=A0AAD6VDP8_9AGAR|nr:hypothetical protein GGX14DRAFT_456935 [Mycena pura]
MVLFQVYEFAFACCSIAAVALLIWDQVITFGAEVRSVWSRKLSGSTALYAMMRYGTLFEKITVLLLASWYLTPHGCNVAVRVQILPMLVRTIGFGLFSSLRVFALTGKDWRLALLVLLLSFPSAIMPSYVYSHQWAQGVDRYGCQLAYLASPTIHDRLRISGIIADILSESIVIFVTISRTFWVRNKDLTPGEKERPGLGLLLLRNGCIHFVALLVLSLADMLVLIFDHVPAFATRYDYWVVPYYTPVFRTIIICRFLLMLREVYFDELEGPIGEGGARTTGMDNSIRFASRVVGTMGAPVDTSLFDGVGYEDTDEDERPTVYARDPLTTGLALMSASDAKGKMRAETGEEVAMQDLSPSDTGSDSGVASEV